MNNKYLKYKIKYLKLKQEGGSKETIDAFDINCKKLLDWYNNPVYNHTDKEILDFYTNCKNIEIKKETGINIILHAYEKNILSTKLLNKIFDDFNINIMIIDRLLILNKDKLLICILINLVQNKLYPILNKLKEDEQLLPLLNKFKDYQLFKIIYNLKEDELLIYILNNLVEKKLIYIFDSFDYLINKIIFILNNLDEKKLIDILNKLTVNRLKENICIVLNEFANPLLVDKDVGILDKLKNYLKWALIDKCVIDISELQSIIDYIDDEKNKKHLNSLPINKVKLMLDILKEKITITQS